MTDRADVPSPVSERRAARAAAEAEHRASRCRRPALRALMVVTASLLGVATALAVVATVFIGDLVRSYDDGRTVIADAIPTGERPAPSGAAVNVLLIGSDSRDSARGADRDGAGGGRSDTLMLAHVPADRHDVTLVSILRDTWVEVPGHGRAKINAAYSWGGVPLTVQTVEQFLDVRVDHVAEIDFAGFEDMTDALGGVTVQSPRAFRSRGHDFTAGANRLDGAQALAFVRERYSFPDADRTRVRNQQAFVRGVFQQALSAGTLTNPTRVSDFVAATSAHLSVDAGLDARRLVDLVWSLRGIGGQDLHTVTMPTSGSGTSPDGQAYVTVSEADRQALSAALRTDDLDTWNAGVQ